MPRRDSGRDTEVDLKVEDLLIEAKLTETGFTDKRIEVVERYCDFQAVFEPSTLPMLDGQYRHYQLLRNVLAAHHLGFRFRLICDERRDDLIDAVSISRIPYRVLVFGFWRLQAPNMQTRKTVGDVRATARKATCMD